MPTLWTYPWSVYEAGGADALADLAARGVDGLNLASHYHSVETMDPKHPDNLFESYSAGCYFDPQPEEFSETPIDPIPNDVRGVEDPLADIVDLAGEQGMDVNAWTVCLHNTPLAVANESFRVESALGDPRDHCLCPSHPEVRDYFAALVGAVADRGVAEVQLEKVGFPSVFHQHGREHGHPKRQAITSTAEETLLSQCFCDGCRAAAADHHVEMDAAQARVRELLDDAFGAPDTDSPPLASLVQSEPHVRNLLDFRASVIDDLLAATAEAAGEVDLSYYLMEWPGFEPGDGWPTGVRLSALDDHLDRIKALCYVSDPTVAEDRIRTLRRAVDLPVDAGVTFAPDVIDRESQFRSVVDALRAEGVGKVSVYHHGIMTETHLDWVEAAFA
jgi:hypothetical protein